MWEGRYQKIQDCKALDVTCRGCGKKGHFEKACLKGKHSTHSLEVPQASNTSTAGAGASEPLYFDNGGQPVYTYMVISPCEQTFNQVSNSIGLYNTQGQ